jgi:predicted porin
VAPSVGFSNYEVNGVYQLTPTVALAGSYTYTKGSTSHWHNGGVQADYQFSKRTDTYLEAIYQRSSSGAPAVINSADPSSSHNQVLIGAGLRHRF